MLDTQQQTTSEVNSQNTLLNQSDPNLTKIEKYSSIYRLLKQAPSYADRFRLLKIRKLLRNYTMISVQVYIANLLMAMKIRDKQIDGCVVECGVWRGGMVAGIAKVLGNKRDYYLCDSFAGLPKPNALDGEKAQAWAEDYNSPFYLDNCKAEITYAKQAMQLANIDNANYIQGWFENTLPKLKPKSGIALLHIDGDWYDSVLTSLNYLYKYMTPGGIILIDDYYLWDGCARAVHQFLAEHKLNLRIEQNFGHICSLTVPTN